MEILQLQMRLIGLSIKDIALVFFTHGHLDHINLGHRFVDLGAKIADCSQSELMEGVETIRSPGHSDDHYILKFNDGTGEVVVAGDAVISLDYYKELAPYWMNGYSEDEIEITRHTMYSISRMADIIIPGHGQPFVNDEAMKDRIEKLWHEVQGSL